MSHIHSTYFNFYTVHCKLRNGTNVNFRQIYRICTRVCYVLFQEFVSPNDKIYLLLSNSHFNFNSRRVVVEILDMMLCKFFIFICLFLAISYGLTVLCSPWTHDHRSYLQKKHYTILKYFCIFTMLPYTKRIWRWIPLDLNILHK